MNSNEGADGPLAGLRVLDFGTAWAGPHATETLALLGADVVKVESRRRLDLFRAMAGIETTPGFNDINLSKRSVCIDLSLPEGRELASRLASVADVAVDNYRPGVMARLGLDYDTLQALNPAIICASVSAFGATGPDSGHAGYAAIFCAMGGLAEVTGYYDWEPALVRSPMDLSVANATAASIVSAVVSRDLTGTGMFIDVSATDVVSTLIPAAIVAAGTFGRNLPRRANESHGDVKLQEVYRATGDDCWVAVSVQTDDQIAALSRVFDSTGEIADVSRSLREWVAARSPAEAAEALQKWGIPAVPTMSPAAIIADQHLSQRGLFAETNHPVQGPLLAVGRIWRSNEPKPRPAPLLGEHTVEVLRSWLKMSDIDIHDLEEAGILS